MGLSYLQVGAVIPADDAVVEERAVRVQQLGHLERRKKRTGDGQGGER